MMKASEKAKVIQVDSMESIDIISPDYVGIASVLTQIVELYKVCENKQLIDKCLETLIAPPFVINKTSDLKAPCLTYEEIKKYS